MKPARLWSPFLAHRIALTRVAAALIFDCSRFIMLSPLRILRAGWNRKVFVHQRRAFNLLNAFCPNRVNVLKRNSK